MSDYVTEKLFDKVVVEFEERIAKLEQHTAEDCYADTPNPAPLQRGLKLKEGYFFSPDNVYIMTIDAGLAVMVTRVDASDVMKYYEDATTPIRQDVWDEIHRLSSRICHVENWRAAVCCDKEWQEWRKNRAIQAPKDDTCPKCKKPLGRRSFLVPYCWSCKREAKEDAPSGEPSANAEYVLLNWDEASEEDNAIGTEFACPYCGHRLLLKPKEASDESQPQQS